MVIWLGLVVLCLGVPVQCAEDTCYTPGSVAGIVIATVVVTIVIGGLVAAVIWHLFKQRKVVEGEKQNSFPKNITCPPMAPDQKPIVRDVTDYAFDNPYFKDDDLSTPDAAEKGESGYHAENGDANGAQNVKQNGQKAKKLNPFSNLPFHAVFHPSGKKQRATMDDTYISKHLERLVVPLRGHDFTGLGFNICGNMRDGIFVKDVLHRGPASESGKIKSGDRIVGVTVSFAAMVYEDALTILSYASPYDVKLEIEKPSEAPTASPKRLAPPSTSFRSGNQRNRLFHPLYRSQSIDDLTQIGKESFAAGSQSTGSQRDSSSSTPKRSQSIEAGASKSRAFPVKIQEDATSKPESTSKSRKSSTSSRESGHKNAAAVVDEKVTAHSEPVKEECKKVESKSSRFRVEHSTPTKTEAPPITSLPPVKPVRDVPPQVLPTDQRPSEPQKPKELPTATESSKKNEEQKKTADIEVSNGDVPTAPPRKISTNGKRKAPAPPPAPKTEAVVHRADEKTADTTVEVIELPPPLDSIPPPLPTEAAAEEEVLAVESSVSLDSGESTEEAPSSRGQRKASSLGDLTKLNQAGSKEVSPSAVLERAVSLDLQQQNVPSDNLMKQKKILRAPAFEDYDEDHEDDLRSDEPPALKRWEESLDKVLTNGTSAIIESFSKEVLNGHHATEEDILKDEPFDLDFDPPDIPAPKLSEAKDFPVDDTLVDDDVPYLASKTIDLEPVIIKQQVKGTALTTVSVSIPVIKPDMTHFDKLPSPPPANTHPTVVDQSWRITSTSNSRQQSPEDALRTSLERLSVQSMYSPVFQKTEKLVNGEVSSPSSEIITTTTTTTVEHCSTSLDGDSVGDDATNPSVVSVTVTKSSSSSSSPSGAAGFAKTLIVPGAGPSEVEDLLRLATVDDAPTLDQPPPASPVVENV